ncbi:MAG TPA: tetratricopeptide repeat protein [Vicinamibacterales bacterium]|nr:tetratricopeptide repeat protein [Vicinamibacterales bacterium]
MTDVSLFGLNAGGHHAVNVALHIANTLLVFWFFKTTTGRVALSAFVAAAFGVHPLHVESVAWIAERKDVLSSFFILLTMVAYAGYARKPERSSYWVVVFFFLLALMAKPMAVTLPMLLLLLDLWPLNRVRLNASLGEWAPLIREKVPLMVLAFGVAAATVLVQARIGAMAGLSALPWWIRAANALVSYALYALKTLWPIGLAPFYPLRLWSPAAVGAAALFLLAASVGAFFFRRRSPAVFIGWCWFVVGLLPVSGLLQSGQQAMADRFVYMPIIGLLVALVWGVSIIAKSSAAVRVGALAAVITIVLLAIVARAQAATWASSVTLWSHAVQVTQDNYLALQKLGDALADQGDFSGALTNYDNALAVTPAGAGKYFAVIHNAKALALMHLGRPDQALPVFRLAVEEDGEFAEARLNFGNALAATGELDPAADQLAEAARLMPGLSEAHVGLGGIRLRQDRAPEARAQFREALALEPGSAEAHDGLGSAFAMQGQLDAALAEYQEALRLKPSLATAHLNMGIVLAKKGETARAIEEVEKALSADPTLVAARRALEALKR